MLHALGELSHYCDLESFNALMKAVMPSVKVLESHVLALVMQAVGRCTEAQGDLDATAHVFDAIMQVVSKRHVSAAQVGTML